MPDPTPDPSAPEFADTRTSSGATPARPDGPTADYSHGPTRTPTPGAPDAGDLPEVPGFEVLRAVGSGGMGSVFEAIQLGTRRRVALKLMLTGWPVDPRASARFEREAEILAAIDHPNVVSVYHAGTWHGQRYLVMKFVSGGTLAQRLPELRRHRRAACRLLATVARAVGHLHARGFVHRDLKPANVLIAEDGTPVVADLGLARSLTDGTVHPITRHPAPLGTRPYMSPEQTRGGADSFPPACDIWALGVILYELLAEERPFADDEPSELFRQIRNDPTPRVPAKLDVPPELEAVARRCLAKEPADRYPTAEALAADLEAWADRRPMSPLAVPATEPQSVAPKPQPEPPPTPPARRPFAALAALAALLATVAGALFVLADRDPVPNPAPEQAPMPHPAPTLAERVARWEEVELIGPNGELRVPAEPALPGSALVPGRDGFPALTGRGASAALFQLDALACPVELVGEVALSSPHPGTGFGGFAVGAQAVPINNEVHLIVWTFGARAEGDRDVGDTFESEVCGSGALRFVRSKDKFPSAKDFTSQGTAALRYPAKEPPPLFWHPIRIEVRPDALSATFRGTGIGPPRIDATKSLSALHTATGMPRAVPVAVGSGLGLFALETEALFRNVRLRRLP